MDTETTTMEAIAVWIQSVGLEKAPKPAVWTNSVRMRREFADGRLVAELLKRFYPKLVETSKCPSVSSAKGKADNWKYLKQALVKCKIGITLSDTQLDAIVEAKVGGIIPFLDELRGLNLAVAPLPAHGSGKTKRAATAPTAGFTRDANANRGDGGVQVASDGEEPAPKQEMTADGYKKAPPGDGEELNAPKTSSEQMGQKPANGEQLEGTPANGEELDGTPANGEEMENAPSNGDEMEGTPANGEEKDVPAGAKECEVNGNTSSYQFYQ